MNLNPGIRKPEIQYSKAFINGVLSISDWGVNPNKSRSLKFYHLEYTYWDYIDAWSKTFYYQNSYNTHSWRFRLENFKWPEISDLKTLPHWFFSWFHKFGPEPVFLPTKPFNLQTIFSEYSNSNPKIKDITNPILNYPLFHFLGQYEIPWIFQWSFTISNKNNLYLSTKELFYKWWPKFKLIKVLKQVKGI